MSRIKGIITGRENYIFRFLQILSGILFFFFLGQETGYVMHKDSPWYIDREATMGVMPIYPWFLQILRFVFGENLFLDAAMIIQGLLAILCSLVLAEYIGRKLVLKRWQQLIVYVFSFLPYAYALPQNVVSHEIMTEALAFPLFYIYFILVLDALLDSRIRQLHISWVMVLILIGLRKQFLFLLAVNFLVYIWFYLRNGKIARRIVAIGVLVCIVLVSGILFTANYFPQILDVLDKSQVVDAMIGKTIYVSEKSDVELFKSDELKGAFLTLYEFADKEEQLFQYAGEYSSDRWIHITEGMNHSTANCWRNVYEYSLEAELPYEMVESMQTDIMFVLFMHHFKDLLIVFGELVMQSLISAIFVKKAEWYVLCQIITLILYVSGFILRHISKKKLSDVDSVCTVFELTMLILGSNVLILNLLFMGLQRYVVYTFGVFYISLFVMFIKLWENKRDSITVQNRSK